MSVALLNQGFTMIRDDLKTRVTHVTLSDATVAFSAAHTGINGTDTNKSVLVKASTDSDVGTTGFDASITIDGTTEFTNKTIWSIGVADGTGVLQTALGTGTGYGSPVSGTDTISRTVRSQGIGVQAGDTMTIAVRSTIEDNS